MTTVKTRLRRLAGRAHSRRRHVVTVTAIIVLALVVPTISYTRALLYPGHAGFAARSVEWVRGHGGNGLVNAIELWRYTHDAPPATGAPADAAFGHLTQVGQPPSDTRLITRHPLLSGPAPVTPLPVLPQLAGEGVWRSIITAPSASPTLYTSWFRPDAAHAPVTVAAAFLPRGTDRFTLMSGTREPVEGMSPSGTHAVPTNARAALVATFNSGFKTRDARGGWYAHGKAAVPLVDGAGSLVVDDHGQVKIGAWGRDVGMTPHVTAVRQNLLMIVYRGSPVAGLDKNVGHRFGTLKSQFEYTWRSGVGVNAHGDVIYVAGQHLTLVTLARAMSQAGIQRGLELDIHPHQVSFNIEQHTASGLRPAHLLASMNEPTDRYLVADQRDFFYVTTR